MAYLNHGLSNIQMRKHNEKQLKVNSALFWAKVNWKNLKESHQLSKKILG